MLEPAVGGRGPEPRRSGRVALIRAVVWAEWRSLRRGGAARVRANPAALVALVPVVGVVLGWNLVVGREVGRSLDTLAVGEPAGVGRLVVGLVVGCGALWLVVAALSATVSDPGSGPLAWVAGLRGHRRVIRGVLMLVSPVGVAWLAGAAVNAVILVGVARRFPGAGAVVGVALFAGLARAALVVVAAIAVVRSLGTRRWGSAMGPTSGALTGAVLVIGYLAPAWVWAGEDRALVALVPSLAWGATGLAGALGELVALVVVAAGASAWCGALGSTRASLRPVARDLSPARWWGRAPNAAAFVAIARRHPLSLLAGLISSVLAGGCVVATVTHVGSAAVRWSLSLAAIIVASAVVEPARQDFGKVRGCRALRLGGSHRWRAELLGAELAGALAVSLVARVLVLPVVPPDVGFEVEWLRSAFILVFAIELVVVLAGEAAGVSGRRAVAVIATYGAVGAALDRALGGDHPLAVTVVVACALAVLALWWCRDLAADAG